MVVGLFSIIFIDTLISLGIVIDLQIFGKVPFIGERFATPVSTRLPTCFPREFSARRHRRHIECLKRPATTFVTHCTCTRTSIYIYVPLPQSFAVARTSEGRRRRWRRRTVNTVNNRARAKWKKNAPVTYYSGPCAHRKITK